MTQDLAPHLFRQRLLIEGFYQRSIDEAVIEEFLVSLAHRLGLRTYGRPVIFAPRLDEGKAENMGYDAFVPLIDSGIAAYFWTAESFTSVVIFSCKEFDPQQAKDFTRDFLDIPGQLTTHPF